MTFRHLEDNHVSYLAHFQRALKYSIMCFLACFALLCHAVYPDVFENTGSNIISHLYFEMASVDKPKKS
jgi:hypothetical protein